MRQSEQIGTLVQALRQVAAEAPTVAMNRVNKFIGNNYADLGAVTDAVMPYLIKHGVVVSTFPDHIIAGEAVHPALTFSVFHGEEWLSSTFPMPTSSEKGKSQIQLAGSNISYLRRYFLAAVFNLISDQDTDGNVPRYAAYADKTPAPADAQARRLFDEFVRINGEPPENGGHLREWVKANKSE